MLNKNFWTLPNIFTFSRLVFGSPVVIWLSYHENVFAAIMFAMFVATDVLDGLVARHYNLVSEWGKRWDPIADQALVLPILWFFAFEKNMALLFWLTPLVLTIREVWVFFLRSKAQKRGLDISAHQTGKIKVTFEYIAIFDLLVGGTFFTGMGYILLGWALIFAMVSFGYYWVAYMRVD